MATATRTLRGFLQSRRATMIRFARATLFRRCGFDQSRAHGNDVVVLFASNSRGPRSRILRGAAVQLLSLAGVAEEAAPPAGGPCARSILIVIKYLSGYQRRNARFNSEPIRRLPRTKDRAANICDHFMYTRNVRAVNRAIRQ